MMFERVQIVFSKEVWDNFRDRRALTSMLLGTLIGPGLMLLLFFVLGRSFTEQAERVLEIPVLGADYAQNLVKFLEQNNIMVIDEPLDNPEEMIRQGVYDLVVVIRPGFGELLEEGYPAEVQLILDQSRQSSALTIERVRRVIRSYSDTLASMRLVSRGVSPVIINPIVIESLDVATPQSQAAQLLNMMPYFIIFSVFLGGMHLAIDTTAGERERGSLEALLINPVSRSELVLGKLGSIMLFTLFSLMGTLIAFGVMLSVVPLEEFLGTRIGLNLGSFLGIFFVSLPMVAMASALQMIISSFSRNFKEAQSYLSFLPLIPALPGMFLAFIPVKATVWMMAIPTFGQQLLINQMMRGEPVLVLNLVVSITITLAISGILAWISMRLYEREAILFGR